MNVPNFPLPEAGGPRSEELIGGDYELVAGGSAVNVCRRLAATGVFAPVFVGMIGKDAMGGVLTGLLERDGVEAQLERSYTAMTPIAFGMTSSDGEHLMCIAGSANQQLDDRAVDRVKELIKESQYLFLGGIYKLHGVLPHLSELVVQARQLGVDVVVDHARVPAGTDETTKQLVREVVAASTIYLPSRDELLETWNAETIEDALEIICAVAPNLVLAVKNGADEVRYRSPDEQGSVQPPRVETVVELTGVGDTFNAYLLASLARGESLRSAVEAGCTRASQRVAGTFQTDEVA
jgi:sugar/nucleoside kinase (ribokinase family)